MMNKNELSIPNIVGELVKNSIDAQSNVIEVAINESFDLRVLDNGCGFDEQTLLDIGKRQVVLSPSLQKTHFPYGKEGNFLFNIAQHALEICIESIKSNSDVRLLKRINVTEPAFEVFRSERSLKNAFVKTTQGSLVALTTLNVIIGDTILLKTNIIDAVIELALINFEIDISVVDTATNQTLYRSRRTKNLFDKFEQFLESHQFFSKIQSVSCEKHDVKVELFLCKDGTQNKAFQFVYFNKLCEHNGKWMKFTNKLCGKRFEKDLNAKHPVYLMNICVDNYLKNQLVYNTIIDKCIRKCLEQSEQPVAINSSSPVPRTVSKPKAALNVESITDGEVVRQEKDGSNDKGVRLGDWIFNNSCEDYEKLNLGRQVYRKKICEKWVISLEKPKPKDVVNDSLNSVVVNKNAIIEPDDHLFKKPKPLTRKSKWKGQQITTKSASTMRPTPYASSQIYTPSQQVHGFDDSGLIRSSKKLVMEKTIAKKRHSSAKARIEQQFEFRKAPGPVETETTHRRSSQQHVRPISPLDNFNLLSMESVKPTNQIDESNDPFPPPIFFESNTLDFRWRKQTTNFNMNFSSSIAIHQMNNEDDIEFMKFLENDVGDVNASDHWFNTDNPPANNVSLPAKISGTQTQYELKGPSGSASVYSEGSEIRYRRHRTDTIRSHHRQQSYRNFGSFNDNMMPNTSVRSQNSLKCNRSGSSSAYRKSNAQPKPIQNPSVCGTAVEPMRKENNSPLDLLSQNVHQTGWPVTININFGQTK